jgi:hydrogenase nickel incorporation protein HypA/HybF
MHERAHISKTVIELVSLADGRQVSQVTLGLGPGTDAAVVEQTWRSATAGTALAGASLVCVTRNHGLQCLDCGSEYEGSKLTPCPTCGGNGLIIDHAPVIALGEWLVGEPV